VQLVQGEVGRLVADHTRPLIEGQMDPDPAVARRVFDAMMGMGKIDVAAIEAARRGRE
jgi:predicted 3-demethylubiquinone-9 3-methyltransferase (glyoxalase superfamily)